MSTFCAMPSCRYLTAGIILACLALAPAAASTAPVPTIVPDTVQGNYRGYLTTPQELAAIRKRAALNIEPYKSAVADVLAYAGGTLPPPDSGLVNCSASTTPTYLTKGGPLVYAYALAFHLTGNAQYASKVSGAIKDLRSITALSEGDCPLTFGRHIPSWIRAADLIEENWSRGEKRTFQDWLAAVVYPSLMTKYNRGNNWGPVITNAGQHIADYCHDRSDLTLGGESPAMAYSRMRQAMLERMNGNIWDNCGEGVSMVRPDGGIPEELRRSTTCDDTKLALDSSAHHYMEGWISGAVGQAELCLRRGDRAIYDNIMTEPGQTAGGKTLPAGRGSLKKAILFVIGPPNDLQWRKLPTLMIAARYYQDPLMLRQARTDRPWGANTTDYANQFGTLTHDFTDDDDPGAPPTVPPPGGWPVKVAIPSRP